MIRRTLCQRSHSRDHHKQTHDYTAQWRNDRNQNQATRVNTYWVKWHDILLARRSQVLFTEAFELLSSRMRSFSSPGSPCWSMLQVHWRLACLVSWRAVHLKRFYWYRYQVAVDQDDRFWNNRFRRWWVCQCWPDCWLVAEWSLDLLQPCLCCQWVALLIVALKMVCRDLFDLNICCRLNYKQFLLVLLHQLHLHCHCSRWLLFLGDVSWYFHIYFHLKKDDFWKWSFQIPVLNNCCSIDHLEGERHDQPGMFTFELMLNSCPENCSKEIDCPCCLISASNYLIGTWRSLDSRDLLHMLQIHSNWFRFSKISGVVVRCLHWSFVSFEHIVNDRSHWCLQYRLNGMSSNLGPCSMLGLNWLALLLGSVE